MNLLNKILWRFNLELYKIYPRSAISFMKKYFKGREVVGAEIGVYTGGNAKSILETLNIKKLYLIDPYECYNDYPNGNFNKAKEKAINNVLDWDYKVEFIEKKSEDAVDDISELDFVYIDGNQNYTYVKKDIESYWNKLKVGGVISGHGFYLYRSDYIKAVIEFVVKNNLKLFVDKQCWWIIKWKK